MKKWDATTLKIVQAVWAMFIGTVMIGGALFYVLPHLLEDGAFSRDDLYLVGGLIVVSLVMALPSVLMQVVGNLVTGLKAWRNGSKE